MNRPEFSMWWADFGSRFPNTAEWVTEKGGPVLLGLWFEALQGYPVTDAMEANQRMFLGESRKPAAYEREDTPAFVMLAIKEIRDNRDRLERQRERQREARDFKRTPSRFPAGRLYVEMCRALRPVGDRGGLGLTPEDARRHIRNKLEEWVES